MHAVFGVCIVDAAPPSTAVRLTGKALRFADCRGAFLCYSSREARPTGPALLLLALGGRWAGAAGSARAPPCFARPVLLRSVQQLRAGDAAHHGHQPGPGSGGSVPLLRAAPLGAGPLLYRCCS